MLVGTFATENAIASEAPNKPVTLEFRIEERGLGNGINNIGGKVKTDRVEVPGSILVNIKEFSVHMVFY